MTSSIELPTLTAVRSRRDSDRHGASRVPTPLSFPSSTPASGAIVDSQPSPPPPSNVDSNALHLNSNTGIPELELARSASAVPGGDANSQQHPQTQNEDAERELPALLPVDRGRAAWSYLIAATLVEMIVWGLPYSVGVLHAYWATVMFPHDESTITLAATLHNGLLFVSAGFLGPLLAAAPQYSRQIQILGLVAGTVGLLASAFVTEAWHLILTIGIVYPLCGGLYLPCVAYLYEWFHERRGLASGIMFSGAAAGGTFFPLLGHALLDGVAYKATMITLGAIFGVLNGVALLFIKRRIPLAVGLASGRRIRPKIDLAFLRKRSLWAMTGFVVLTSMGNFIPSLWMPTFADVVGPTKPAGTSLVALMYAASVLGNLLTGYLSDRIPVGIVLCGSCAISALATWVLWGFGTTDALLIIFCLVWGVTALSTAAAWSKMITYISKDDLTLPGLLFAIETALRGAGNYASGPISTSLLQTRVLKGAAGVYGSTNYGVLLLFTGAITFVGGLAAALFPIT